MLDQSGGATAETHRHSNILSTIPPPDAGIKALREKRTGGSTTGALTSFGDPVSAVDQGQTAATTRGLRRVASSLYLDLAIQEADDASITRIPGVHSPLGSYLPEPKGR